MKEILRFNPCDEAVEFIKDFDSFEDAWNTCPRGDWMLWIAGKLKVEEKLMFKAKALCAKTVMHLMRDERSVTAVNKALEYSEGLISEEEIDAYAFEAKLSATWARSYAATRSYAEAAAYATAALAAYASATCSYIGDDTATYAAASVGAVSVFDKRKNQKQTEFICREVLTDEVFRLIKL